MNQSIFDRIAAAVRAFNGTLPPDSIPIHGEWQVKVIRHDGSVECQTLKNVVTAGGLNRIANRAVQATGTSLFNWICIGSNNTAAALTDVQSNFGEMVRKAFIAGGASAQSREYIFGTCTVGGAADGVTSLTMNCAGLFDFPNSHATNGLAGNRVTGLAVTLGNSDFMNLTCRIRVGSHDVSHST